MIHSKIFYRMPLFNTNEHYGLKSKCHIGWFVELFQLTLTMEKSYRWKCLSKHQQQFTLTSNSDNNLYRNKSLIVCLIDFCVLSYTHNGRKMVNREWKKIVPNILNLNNDEYQIFKDTYIKWENPIDKHELNLFALRTRSLYPLHLSHFDPFRVLSYFIQSSSLTTFGPTSILNVCNALSFLNLSLLYHHSISVLFYGTFIDKKYKYALKYEFRN